jgi:hypothetical protein
VAQPRRGCRWPAGSDGRWQEGETRTEPQDPTSRGRLPTRRDPRSGYRPPLVAPVAGPRRTDHCPGDDGTPTGSGPR